MRELTASYIGGGSFKAEHNNISCDVLSAKLTVIEGKLLLLLLTHEGKVFSTDRIIELLWDNDTETNDSVIKTYIRHLRMKIATVLGDVPVIHTVLGMGYSFRQPHQDIERSEPTSQTSQAV